MRSCIGLDHLIHLKTVSLLLPTPFYYIYYILKKKKKLSLFGALREGILLIERLLFFLFLFFLQSDAADGPV